MLYQPHSENELSQMIHRKLREHRGHKKSGPDRFFRSDPPLKTRQDQRLRSIEVKGTNASPAACLNTLKTFSVTASDLTKSL